MATSDVELSSLSKVMAKMSSIFFAWRTYRSPSPTRPIVKFFLKKRDEHRVGGIRTVSVDAARSGLLAKESLRVIQRTGLQRAICHRLRTYEWQSRGWRTLLGAQFSAWRLGPKFTYIRSKMLPRTGVCTIASLSHTHSLVQQRSMWNHRSLPWCIGLFLAIRYI